MDIMHHPQTTQVLGAPPGWDPKDGPCDALPVIVIPSSNGQVLQSYWKPDAQEIAMLAAGGYISLGIFSKEHPVVALGATPAVEGAFVV